MTYMNAPQIRIAKTVNSRGRQSSSGHMHIIATGGTVPGAFDGVALCGKATAMQVPHLEGPEWAETKLGMVTCPECKVDVW